MPALQVRDFPATLYDELKEYAARNHRSIAQQTIIAVEEMLAEASALRQEPFPVDADRLSRSAPRNGDIQLASAGVAKGSFWQERGAIEESRAQRRQQIFANFDELNWKCKTLTTDEIIALVREGREERTDRIMASLDPFADIEDEGGVNDRSGC